MYLSPFPFLSEIYPTLPKNSIDKAVMEPASQGKGKAKVVTVKMPVNWLDVGSWPALAETLHVDDHENAIECKSCIFMDSDNNIVVSSDPEHLISTIGVSDMIIVHTPQITMICPFNQLQIGGDGGSRTHVRKSSIASVYVCRRWFRLNRRRSPPGYSDPPQTVFSISTHLR